MPQIFRIGNYVVYFWSNENKPLEPIHIHISLGVQSANATKVWISKEGKCVLCHNDSQIPSKDLKRIFDIIEIQSTIIVNKWYEFFGEIKFYC